MVRMIQMMTVKGGVGARIFADSAAIQTELERLMQLDRVAQKKVFINLVLIEVDSETGYSKYPQVEDVEINDIIIDGAAVYYREGLLWKE